MSADEEMNTNVKQEVKWHNVLFYIYLHMSALYGILLVFTQAKLLTSLFALILIAFSMVSVTLGCHRLWAHNVYKACFPLRLFFVIGHTLCAQGSIYDWVLDHRIHHKYHGTELDPYNYKRGFLYSQLGSKVVTQNPDLNKIKKEIDMTDIEQDSLVMWQKTLYWFLMPVFSLLLTINAPVEYWNESTMISIFVVGFLRLAISNHIGWLINSAIPLWGLDPTDRKSAETNLVFIVNKSLWPQYHYLLPWDYRSGEYGNYGDGICNALVRMFAALGWITDLKTVDSNDLKKALYKSCKTGQNVIECIEDLKTTHSFEDILETLNTDRKPE